MELLRDGDAERFCFYDFTANSSRHSGRCRDPDCQWQWAELSGLVACDRNEGKARNPARSALISGIGGQTATTREHEA